MPYKDPEKRKEAWKVARKRYLEKKKGMTEGMTGYDLGMTQGMTQGMTRERVTLDTVKDDTLTPATEPELDPTVLYLTVLSQRVDALAAEITELKKVGLSAIKIDSLMPVLRGMNEEVVKEIKERIVKLEEAVESLETRVSKIEEMLQEFQLGVSVGLRGGVHSSRHSSRDNGNGDLPYGKSAQAQGKLPKRYIFGKLVE